MAAQISVLFQYEAYFAFTELSRYFRNFVRPKLVVLKNLSLRTQMSSSPQTVTKWVKIKSLGPQFVIQKTYAIQSL